MKQIFNIVLIVFVPVLLLVGCGQTSESNRLEGAWELVEVKYTPPDQAFLLTEWRQIKLLTKTHWAYLSQKRSSPKITGPTNDSELLAAAKAFGAGGGTYTLVGDVYTERIEFFSTPNYVSVSLPYRIKWEGDEWIMTGTFPMKSMGLGDQDIELYERYRRVK